MGVAFASYFLWLCHKDGALTVLFWSSGFFLIFPHAGAGRRLLFFLCMVDFGRVQVFLHKLCGGGWRCCRCVSLHPSPQWEYLGYGGFTRPLFQDRRGVSVLPLFFHLHYFLSSMGWKAVVVITCSFLSWSFLIRALNFRQVFLKGKHFAHECFDLTLI